MRAVLASLGLAIVGCYQPDYGDAPFLCQHSVRCPPGYRCVAGVCRDVAPSPDGAPTLDRDVARPDRALPAELGVDAVPAADIRADTAVDAAADLAPTCVAGSGCDDANPCTANDVCLAGGGCAGTPLAAGTRCGALPAAVCCAGICVDVSADPANCGGCGLACAPGYSCGDAASPPKCSDSPADTSGRCRCADGDSALCPNGQSCRTNTPADGWCSPSVAADCAPGQRVEFVSNCPNYCAY